MNDDSMMAITEAKTNRRKKEFRKFFELAQNLKAAIVDFASVSSDDPLIPLENDRVRAEVPLAEANCVSSKIREGSFAAPAGWHLPTLDIDVPMWVSESTTPGHHHLIIYKPISWEKYSKLLEMMADCGILEEGLVRASLARKASWVRTPWTAKRIQEGV